MIGHLKDGWLVLVLMAVGGLALATTDRLLAPRIAANERARLERLALEVVPEGTHVTAARLDGRAVLRVEGPDGLAGWAVRAEGQGFADVIGVLVGVTPDGGRLTGVAILSSRETPGLGDRIHDAAFRRRFVGWATDGPLHIDGVSGATISSKAVIAAVARRMGEVRAALLEARTP